MTGHRVSRTLGGVKPRQILAILALAAGRPVSKEHLADLLWDGEPPKGYRGTLESYAASGAARCATPVVATAPSSP